MIIKKSLSLILCAAMIAPVTASAVTISANESAAEIYAESSKSVKTVTVPFSAKKGETITFYFTVKDTPSVAGFLSEITYKMSYLRYKNTVNYYDNTYSNPESGIVYLSVLFSENGVNMSNETKIAAVTFTARKDIPESAAALSYTINEFYDSALKEINYSKIGCAANSNLNVSNPHVHTIVTDPARRATCNQTGLTEGSHCSVCGEVITEQKEIPKTSHQFENGKCKICGAADPDNMKFIYGDVDNDGEITSSDALHVLRKSVNLEEFNSAQEILADVDGDNMITSADSLAILRHSVKLPSEDIIGKKYNP